MKPSKRLKTDKVPTKSKESAQPSLEADAHARVATRSLKSMMSLLVFRGVGDRARRHVQA